MTEKTTEKVALANTPPPPASPPKAVPRDTTIAPQDTALVELQWAQCQFSLELLKDSPNAARLDELGRMIQRAEKHALAAERRRPTLRVPLFRGFTT